MRPSMCLCPDAPRCDKNMPRPELRMQLDGDYQNRSENQNRNQNQNTQRLNGGNGGNGGVEAT